MRRSLLVLTIAVSVAFSVLLRAQDLVYGRFGDYLESLRVQAGIPGMAAIVVGTADVQWERAFGQQDVDRNIGAQASTPFHVDGIAQILTASLVLRCAEEGRLALDDLIAKYKPDSPEAGATIRQVLSYTSGPAASPSFSYRTERLDALVYPLGACHTSTYRGELAKFLEQMGMFDSVPGPDAVNVSPPADGITSAMVSRYGGVLSRLAVPYSVNSSGKASASRYPQTILTPASGLVSTVRDFARFDLALKKGAVLRSDTLGSAWSAPAGANGQRLPHGLGWFVQSYNGETVVWQFGVSDNASSSLVLTVPGRGLTLILLANSDRLTRPFPLASGDVTVSPYARLFLGLFVR